MVKRAIAAAKVSFLLMILYDLFRIFIQGFMIDSVDKMMTLAVESLIVFAVLFCILFVVYSGFR